MQQPPDQVPNSSPSACECPLSQIEAVNVEISVVLGRSVLPMAQLLRMGRGAVIPLDASERDEVWILANNHPVARGEIAIHEDRIAITEIGRASCRERLEMSV